MINRRNYKNICVLLALTSISCSDSEGWMSGIPLSNEKISFTASLQEGWSGGQGSGDKSRAVKPDFPGLAREQKVLSTDEAFSKPLYLHPLETENTTVMNAMPQTRGVMNESSTVGSFGVSAVYSKGGANSSLFHNEEATQNGSYWFTSSNATWPLDGSVSFYAYAPYKDASLSLQGSDAVVKNKTIRYTANTDFSMQPDLIVAKSENNTFTSKTANKAVGLSFSHALTAITFSISADMIPGTVKSIKVSGVYGEGDYDFSTEKWIHLANPSTYVITPKDPSVKAGESKALTDKNSALLMIPQDLGADAKVSMVFNDDAKDKTVSFSLDGTSWTAGKHITYVLSSSKITTLKMGKLTYPTGWNSVNTDAKNQIRTAYAPNTSAGLFVVNEEKKVIAANVQLTYDGTSWSLPTGSKLKFSPQYSYFVYYPYQDQASLAGLPAVNTTVSDVSISSSTQFFADAIAYWKSHKIAADQSTLDKMNDCDLQIGKASLDEDGCSVSFKMEHAMGLAEIVLDKGSFTNSICYLVGYEEYPTWNGTTTSYASSSIKNHTMYGIADHRYVSIVKPGENSFMSNTDKDAWKEEVKLSPAANEVESGTASIAPTAPHAYTLAVGDIYYSDGAISHQEDNLISTSERIPIGIVGYTTMNEDGNYWTEKGVSDKGGHALVMCLKTIGSTGKTSMGTTYPWYSSNSDVGRTKVNTRLLLVNSYKQSYGSGYTETNALIEIWGPDPAPGAAYQAKNYKTLPAPTNKCTGWFLPSAGQYYAVMTTLGAPFSDDWDDWPEIWDGYKPSNLEYGFFNNMTTVSGNINAALSKVGPDQYTEFFQGTNTWELTSSEYSSTAAVLIDSGIDERRDPGSVRFGSSISKTRQIAVRPFLAF